MIADRGMRNAEWGTVGPWDRGSVRRGRAHRSFPNPTSEIRNPKSQIRSGLTLVELLVTITIIAILASVLLGVAAVAANAGREARTRNMITRLHTLLVEHYDSYQTRRVDTSALEQFAPIVSNEQRADYRLVALRQLIQMEIPDRWSDILGASVDDVPPNAGTTVFNGLRNNVTSRGTPPRFAHPPTPLWDVYIRRYRQLNTNDPNIIRQNQGAECLYMVITVATGDGEARSLFGESEIGDTDGDGAPEFLDGWGNPIGFIRWPAGFTESDRQMNSHDLFRMEPEPRQSMIAQDHDPFDMYRRDSFGSRGIGRPFLSHLRDEYSAYRLVPLIYSAGPDEDADLLEAPDFVRPAQAYTDPYFPLTTSSAPLWIGTPLGTPLPKDLLRELRDEDGDNWADNIHNHYITGE